MKSFSALFALLALTLAWWRPVVGNQEVESPFREIAELQQLLAGVQGTVVPVGGVIMWWGTEDTIPYGFEICDGRSPETRDALLKERKPDLRERFVKGVKDPFSFRPRNAKSSGSNAPVDLATLNTAGTKVSTAQSASHSHRLPSSAAEGHKHSPGAHTHDMGGTWTDITYVTGVGNAPGLTCSCVVTTATSKVLVCAGASPADTQGPSNDPTGLPDNGKSTDDTGGGGSHDHKWTSGSIPVEPAYLEMIYIIRVI